MLKKKVLLVEPSDKEFYKDAKVKEVVPDSASLTLATLAASIIEEGHSVEVMDLGNFINPGKAFEDELKRSNPDVIGVTASTPLFYKAGEVVEIAKKIKPDILAIAGGPHVSGLPKESLEKSRFDILVIGEGDITIKEVLNGNDLASIKGIAYRKDNEVIINERRLLLDNLDKLPLPAWHLFDVEKCVVPKSVARNSPVAFIESSRGCPFNCVFCSKHIFSRQFRMKSVERFILEIKHLQKHGFKEFHLTDDCFTTDMDKAEKICDEMIRQNLIMPWVCLTGIRVDCVNSMLLKKMKQAGCYRVFFGIECLAPDTNIQLANGSIKKIKDIDSNTAVISSNMDNIKLEESDAIKICKNEKTEMLHIKTSMPCREIKCSKLHKFFIISDGNIEEVEAQNLRVGDCVAVMIKKEGLGNPNKLREEYPIIDVKLLEFLGYFTGDGHARKTKQGVHRIRLYDEDIDIINYYAPIIKDKIKNEVRILKEGNKNHIELHSKPVLELLDSFGLTVYSRDKKIPGIIMESSDEDIAAFLRGLFDAEGCATNDSVAIGSTSKTLIEQIRYLMLRLGIESSNIFHATYNREWNKGKITSHTDYKLVIKNKNGLRRFREIINFNCPTKRAKLEKLNNKLKTRKYSFNHPRNDKFPIDKDTLNKLCDNLKLGHHARCIKFNNVLYNKGYCTSKESTKKIINNLNGRGYTDSLIDFIEKIIYSDEIGWAKIKSIDKTYCEVVYDFHAPRNSNYVANGFIVHNSGSPEILKRIRKQISLEQVREAVKMANDAGIETWGSFMIGLPGETEETMQQTIDFAKSLPLDMAKLTITIPLPATDLYNEYIANNQMLTLDWNKFNMYTPARELYKHENLDWDTIEKYYKKFYRSFYFRPKYIWHRLVNDIKNGMLIEHLKIMMKTSW